MQVHPKYFGKNLKDVIEKKLIDEVHAVACICNAHPAACMSLHALPGALTQVEGTCNGRYGYVVCVNKIQHISKVCQSALYAVMHEQG